MRTRDTEKEELVKKKAIAMLVEDGFQGFSMNKLAQICNISVATLYIYYRDKDDLIKKIGADIARRFMYSTLKDFSADMHFAEGLRKQWENRSGFAIKHPVEVACYEIIRHSPHGESLTRAILAEFKDIMGKFCVNAIKAGELIDVPTDVFWCVAYGPLYSLLRFHESGKSIGGNKFKFSKRVMNETLELVIKALTP